MDRSGRAIPLLGDDDFGLVFCIGIGLSVLIAVVVALTMNECDDVSILLGQGRMLAYNLIEAGQSLLSVAALAVGLFVLGMGVTGSIAVLVAVYSVGAGGYGFGGMLGMGGSFGSSADPAPEGDPLRLDPERIVATITERAEQARLDAPDERAAAPVSTWDWVAVAAVVVPGLALLLVALV